jgi:hypothetical protein
MLCGYGVFQKTQLRQKDPNLRNATLARVRAERASTICKLFDQQEFALALLSSEMPPAEYSQEDPKNDEG